ncbi:rab-GTPase-TBC domain-containing protein [Kalaharituber pfeilii]|nr:rab-GTPase-TBC domain-containing protein [Kalaharituber pfeilii]
MRTLQDSRQRWREFIGACNSTASLKSSIPARQHNSPQDVSGLRSLSWKLCLYLPDFPPSNWSPVLNSSRLVYSELRAKLLEPLERGVIVTDDDPKNPIDPLAEDPSNPWSQFRKGEELRREILQDVERCMPDNPYFRTEKVQKRMLDVLCVYCKLNEDIGYRQGMHEIVAPILWVVENDAVDVDDPAATEEDKVMLEMLDSRYIEHDTFSLFQAVMHSVRAWYELGEDGDITGRKSYSPIVEKSRIIHECYLKAVDPQLTKHLKELDVLPQVFLIRWIRLLFGREFPFDELLALWDSLFAEDQDLELVDYICVAMLLRIRWKLLEADYSTALTLLLRYPSPEPPHLPATLVSDAIYLRNHLNQPGGAHIIYKYTHRLPDPVTVPSPFSTPPASPSRRLTEAGSRIRAVSPLSVPVKFIQAQSGLDRLVNDVAKGVLDRGERWGVNKAVREVMGEVKRNVEGLQQYDYSARYSASVDSSPQGARRRKAQVDEQRIQVLAQMLEKSISKLEKALRGQPELSVAIQRIRHVRECLVDSSMTPDEDTYLPREANRPSSRQTFPPTHDNASQRAGSPEIPTTPVTPSPLQVFPQGPSPLPPLPKSPEPIPLVETKESRNAGTTSARSYESSPSLPPLAPPPAKGVKTFSAPTTPTTTTTTTTPSKRTISDSPAPPPPQTSFPTASLRSRSDPLSVSDSVFTTKLYTHRTRSSLAQSGFGWMLGEDPGEIRREERRDGPLFGDEGSYKRGRRRGELFGDEGDDGDGERDGAGGREEDEEEVDLGLGLGLRRGRGRGRIGMRKEKAGRIFIVGKNNGNPYFFY